MFKQGFSKKLMIIFRDILNFWSALAVHISLKWEGKIKDMFFPVISYLFVLPSICWQKIISMAEFIYEGGMKDDIQALLLF